MLVVSIRTRKVRPKVGTTLIGMGRFQSTHRKVRRRMDYIHHTCYVSSTHPQGVRQTFVNAMLYAIYNPRTARGATII